MTGIPEKPIFAVGQVTTDLPDPCGIGTRCDARDVDSTCLQVDDGKDGEVTSPFLVNTSTVLKSVAKIDFQCALRNVDHAGVRCRSGAGSMPFAFSTFPTVESAMW